MDKIIVKHTRIEVNNYDLGDCPKLEYFFSIYDPIYHTTYYKGMEYIEEEKKLILPRGIDVFWLENILNDQAKVDYKYDKFQNMGDIMLGELPRDTVQKEALRFILGKGEYIYTDRKSQLCVNLNTGKGKTYVSVAAISYWCIKSVIIASSIGILEQWKNRILQYTNIEPSEIYTIEGSFSIDKLFKRDCSKYKVFLASHSTLKSYGDKNGWDRISELFKYLGIGIKIYDEAHECLDNILRIDFHTNTYKTLYLTATPARSDRNENEIYQLVFKNVPKIDLFDEDSDPRTKYVAMHFNSHPTPMDVTKCKNQYGFNRNVYTNYVVERPNFYKLLHILIDMIKKVNGKTLIYIGTNQAIQKVYDWMIENYPELKTKIGIYTSIVTENKEAQLDKQIILSTTKSCGAAIDISGLKLTIVLAEPFKSEVLSRQTLGRTRAKNTMYIDIVDDGFFYTKKYFSSKKPIFEKYATECSNVNLRDDEITDRVNTLMDQRSKLNQAVTFCDPKEDKFYTTAITRL